MVVDEKPLLAPASVPLPADAWIALRLIEKMELPVIAALAETIWWHCYPPIIGAAQVHYMLGRGYALPVLSAAYRDGTVFSLLQVGPRSVGFSAWRVVGREGFIDKLYLLPAFHGRGLGRWLIDATCRQIAAAGIDVAKLRVNRHNHVAIRAYQRSGFTITATDRLPIGAGFMMDDYLMRRAGLIGLSGNGRDQDGSLGS